ncbi:DeoR/GlpR family DNA-binding transcription regulator [Luteimicrobium subarcticum]|uniref:DeoR family transcriptional regulator n=1 Tax=Luteimicrobium subarcticum TaxID=620910 RepID=A0A2M8WSK2_9MICO|nr:DeoR/GlpR family DNA-binding transcription regulator [Luteimicrobium subarcticum]PJI93921.1 DeoR family transcriptional regulator [Luteimicrobium subarcticum]
MHTIERRQAIVEQVRRRGVASLRELAAAVDASEVTVRRDVRALEQEGIVDRRRGGAAWPGGLTHEQTYQQKTRVAADEKSAIADVAVGLVEEGDAIVLGAGTTTREVARRLAGFSDLTVVTNSILVAQDLARSSVEVVVTGGSLRGSTFALVGSAAEASLQGVRVRLAFLSGNGLTAVRGLSTPNAQVASVDRAIVAAAQEVVVLADHTKLGVETMMQTVPSESIAHLITDDQADEDELEQLRRLGIEVHVAHLDGAPAADDEE